MQLLASTSLCFFFFFFFFFEEEFQPMTSALYHQTKTPVSFWCRRGLNPRSLIQSSETLLAELTRTHASRSHLESIDLHLTPCKRFKLYKNK